MSATVANARNPLGYGRLVPFERERHGALGLDPGAPARFARRLHAIVITVDEFLVAARQYAIMFTRDPDTAAYVPVAVTGLVPGENRILTADGAWPAAAYVPAYVRRYPFYAVPRSGARAPDVLVCVDEEALCLGEAPLLEADGRPGGAWAERESLVREFERAWRHTRAFVDAVARLDVIRPVEAHAHPADGSVHRLRNLYRVDEARLNALEGRALKALMQVGALSRVYAHLMSMDNLARLLEPR
ncbi:MAG: SapC family protein [Ectothiorhodospiraceae bacterium]|nr:SapC family protein [Chromatiales bacterium]MCP5156727.1 SapC family protein [Ectothiorhodospiraceae bacterium]